MSLNRGPQCLELSLFKFETIADDKKKARDTVRLLGETWDELTGGYEICRCIATDFTNTFDEKFKQGSVLENKRVRRY